MKGVAMAKNNVEKAAITTTIMVAIDALRVTTEVVTLDAIATELAKGGNVTAQKDVEALYGRAVIRLREAKVAVVPVTRWYVEECVAKGKQPNGDGELSASIAGLAGHGRSTFALFFPKDENDLVYIHALIGRMDSGAGKVTAVGREAKHSRNGGLLSTGKAQDVLDHQPKATGLGRKTTLPSPPITLKQ